MARQILINVAGVLAFLVILATLPFVALLLFALRGVFLIAMPAVILAGMIAYAVSPAFREWFQARTKLLVRYKGLRLATDVTFHPSHSWARMENEVLAGADDLVQAALGPVDNVELPPNGMHVMQGEPLFRLRHGDRVVNVPSPVSGTVLSVNAELREHPELINAEPFAHGWAVRIRSDRPSADRKLLLRGKEARTWFRSATDRILALLPPRVGAVSDEGVSVEQLHRQLDDTAWRQLNETMFSPAAKQRSLQV